MKSHPEAPQEDQSDSDGENIRPATVAVWKIRTQWGKGSKVTMRWLMSFAIVFLPAIGLATSERPAVEPVKSETSQKLEFPEEEHTYYDDFSHLIKPANPSPEPKKPSGKKEKSKSRKQNNWPVTPSQANKRDSNHGII